MKSAPLYGLMAEFDSPGKLSAAAQRIYDEGYRQADAYSPFPIHGLAEAMGKRHTRVPALVLIGGIVGASSGYLLQYYCAAVAYPLNVGGRPLNSWPAFVPVTFEMTILLAALTAVVGMLFLNGLPMPYHPAFNVPNFALASRNRFFLLIQSSDPLFQKELTGQLLNSLDTLTVSEVHA